MKNQWEQFRPTEGNDTSLSGIALVASAIFAIGMIVYVLSL